MAAKKSRASRKGGTLMNKNQRKQLESIGYGLNSPAPKPPPKRSARKRK